MATKQNTVAARLSDELLLRFNACIAAEIAARPRVDKLDEYGQGTAVRSAILAWVEAMEASRRDPLPPSAPTAVQKATKAKNDSAKKQAS